MAVTLQQMTTRARKASGTEAGLLEPFIETLFGKADSDFLDAFDSDRLYAMAVDGLAFLQRRRFDELLVEVFNPSFQADGWDCNYTVLRLVLTDRPFIVDSVRAELRRQGHELFHLLHPIVAVERDRDGRVVDLDLRRRQGTTEAFEMYFINRLEERDLEGLEAAVGRVLHDVVLATDDYRPMLERAHQLAEYLRQLRKFSAQGYHRERGEELEEYSAFMEWLDDDNFVFLGYREYDITSKDEVRYLKLAEDSVLGILRKVEESAYRKPVPLSRIPGELRERITGGRVFVVTKTNAEATVHRPARMDYIGIKKLSEGWQVLGEHRFVGLFTSKALSTPVEETPILRRQLRQVLEIDGAVPDSHDYKQIVAIFNTMPREELFWSAAPQLHREIRTIMGLQQERGVRLTLRADPLARGLGIMVIMPRERFNADVRRRIQQLLSERLAASHVDYQLAMGEDQAQVRFHFFFVTELTTHDVDIKTLERDIAELTRSWEDHLRERLIANEGDQRGRQLAKRYLTAFDERYKADTSSGMALRDVLNLEALGDDPYLVDILNPVDDQAGSGATLLKIYHQDRSLVLSQVLPILENLGFIVLEQISYFARLDGMERGIDVFRVLDLDNRVIEVRSHGGRLTEALQRLLVGAAENDRLNRLVHYAGLTIRQVALLRGYQMHYAQLSFVTSRRFINDTLIRHPQVASLLYRYFQVRFDPAFAGDRQAEMAAVEEAFFDALAAVASLPEDQTLRALFDLMRASIRTNYYLGRDYIAFKIASDRVASMPDPRPEYEIGVIGPGVEGIHLRGGKVARGGIRWSDRPDDFRTEVLGLMKTQTTKNAVIVPVGSKGGFVLKYAPADRDALRVYVQEQYRTFIRGLLDLTDNMRNGRVVRPEGLIIYDDDDPYLVVAADKGTATFSDLANEIAAEYDFWLGDAFASGGSHGYDHKAEGITARGAWECVDRHFRELGVNIFEDTFTVVGIGDMSGDVFGNGMLYSDRIRLQAAFNHLHIFLDPDPDPDVGFRERRRLFELSRSSWSDYDPARIGEGGGVYPRAAKSIPLSPQMQALLGVDAEALSGQDLVRAILMMPVDLLWNGGIGTYVKASAERNADVGDAGNDTVRVDAAELRARVVGEGGNLGFTQLARIEFARAGGKINTDAVDNSAGVDMSDHEVNIKILLQPQLNAGELTMVQRNRLLKEMTDEVSALVLRDNYYQSLALSLAERRCLEDPQLFLSQLEYLVEREGLDPKVEFLPSSKQLRERQRSGETLTRPELAVMMAYVKMGLYQRLLETDFPDQPHFHHYLFAYFPKVLQETFADAIERHPLAREITATQFTNTVVDILGPTFVHRSIRDTGARAVEVIQAALVSLEILDVRSFLRDLFALDRSLEAEAQYQALAALVSAVEGIVNWMLLNDLTSQDISTFVDTYQQPMQDLRAGLRGFLPGAERRRFAQAVKHFRNLGVDEPLASLIAGFDYLPSSVGVIEVCRTTKVPLDEAAKRFYAVGERLALGWLRDGLETLPIEGKWEKIALSGLIMDLRQAQQELTSRYVEARKQARSLTPEAFLETYPNLLRRFDQALAEIRQDDDLSIASGGMLVRLLTQAGQSKG